MRSIIDDCYGTARRILEENRDKLDMMAEALLEYETIDRPQIDDIMAGRKPQPPESWDDKDQGNASNAAPEDQEDKRQADDPGPIGDPAPDH